MSRVGQSLTTLDVVPQVSFLYGPGVVACWALTVLSCGISWASTSESLDRSYLEFNDSDVNDPYAIAIITYPITVSIHLVCLAWHLPNIKPNAKTLTSDPMQIERSVAATRAALAVLNSAQPAWSALALISVVFCPQRVQPLIAFQVILQFTEMYLSWRAESTGLGDHIFAQFYTEWEIIAALYLGLFAKLAMAAVCWRWRHELLALACEAVMQTREIRVIDLRQSALVKLLGVAILLYAATTWLRSNSGASRRLINTINDQYRPLAALAGWLFVVACGRAVKEVMRQSFAATIVELQTKTLLHTVGGYAIMLYGVYHFLLKTLPGPSGIGSASWIPIAHIAMTDTRQLAALSIGLSVLGVSVYNASV